MAAFVDALQRNGWLARGTEPAYSRFWRLLQGDAPSMFGVFNDYELQVIHDWIRGDDAVDGRIFERGVADPAMTVRPPVRAFRHARQRVPAPGGGDLSILASGDLAGSDHDGVALRRALADGADPVARGALLRRLLGPAFHWSPAGLEATRHVSSLMRAVG